MARGGRGRWLVAVAVMGGLVAVTGGGARSVGAEPEPEEPETAGEVGEADPRVAAQLAARERFGLDADPGLVADLLAGRVAAMGTPLQILATPDEHEDIAGRLAVQDASGGFHELARTIEPDRFGGTWFDHAGGGLLVAAFTDDDPARVAALVTAAGEHGERVRVRRVARTLAELEHVAAGVYAARGRFAARGVPLVAANPVLPANRVLVEVAGGDEGTARGLIDELIAGADQEAIDIAIRAPGSEVAEQHWAVSGGAPLHQPGTTTAVCSAGAHGYVWFLEVQVPYLVTAGHCHHAAPSGLTHASHDPVFTRVTGLEDPLGGVDVMATNHGSFDHGQVARSVVNYTDASTWPLVGVVAAGATFDVYGHAVCRSGLASGSVCGTIVSTDYRGCGRDGGWRAMSVAGQPGDSGGTVFSVPFPAPEVHLAGFYAGSCSGTGFYTFQENARIALGLHGWLTW